jgi:hypothetical protein
MFDERAGAADTDSLTIARAVDADTVQTMSTDKNGRLVRQVHHVRTTSAMQAFGSWAGVAPDIVDAAIDQLRGGHVVALLGSGAQGSGKDSVIAGVFDRLGFDGVQCRVAHAIRAEMASIVERIACAGQPHQAAGDIAAEFDVSDDTAKLYVSLFFERSREHADEIDVFERTEEMRRALQWHGSEGRSHQIGYWVKRAYQDVIPALANGSNVYLTDGRFPGEVDAGRTMGAYCARLLVPEDVRVVRIERRDGFRPSDASLRHPGEIVLDGYWGLDAEIDNTGPFDETVDLLAELLIEHRDTICRID